MRVRVDGGGLAVGCPASVSHADMIVEGLVHVNLGLLLNKAAKRSNFTDLLEKKDFRIIFSITINSNTYRKQLKTKLKVS